MVPAWLEILTDIAQTKRVGVTFPSTQVLIDWRDRYLRVWDGYIDELEPDEGSQGRSTCSARPYFRTGGRPRSRARTGINLVRPRY